MYGSLARRASTATAILIAMLWLAAGPAVAATPAVFAPSAPAAAEAGVLEALWGWLAGLWAAPAEASFEKTVTPVGDPGATDLSPGDRGDKGVLIDPNGHR